MSTAEIAQQLANGLTLTAIYALIAVGVSLFFGAMGIVNLAHGDVARVRCLCRTRSSTVPGIP